MDDLSSLSQTHLGTARTHPAGRSSVLLTHDGQLRQVLVTLAAGRSLGEHTTPSAASLQVLVGSVRVEFEDGGQETVSAGQLYVFAHSRHSVLAIEDSAFLLTTVSDAVAGDAATA
jgi:quercetin dioxygenase-like cupin family protein